MKQMTWMAALVLAACSGKGSEARPVQLGAFRIAPIDGWKQEKDPALDAGSVMFRRQKARGIAIAVTGPFADDPADPEVCKGKERERRGGNIVMKASQVRTFGGATGCWISGDVGEYVAEKAYVEFVVGAPGGGEALLITCTAPLGESEACEPVFAAVATSP